MKAFIKFLSYVWDIPVEKTSSEHNHYLEVVWTNGKKMLNTKHANFSYGNGYKVFQKACSFINSEIQEAENTLILGFGCGSINQILKDEYNYKHFIYGIEYDQVIIDLFWKHFATEDETHLAIECADAAAFLASNVKSYEIIFVDLFEELDNVQFIFDPSFLSNLMKANPKAIVFNLVAQNNADQNQISNLVMNLSSHFRDVSNTGFQDLNQIIIAK